MSLCSEQWKRRESHHTGLARWVFQCQITMQCEKARVFQRIRLIPYATFLTARFRTSLSILKPQSNTNKGDQRRNAGRFSHLRPSNPISGILRGGKTKKALHYIACCFSRVRIVKTTEQRSEHRHEVTLGFLMRPHAIVRIMIIIRRPKSSNSKLFRKSTPKRELFGRKTRTFR